MDNQKIIYNLIITESR